MQKNGVKRIENAEEWRKEMIVKISNKRVYQIVTLGEVSHCWQFLEKY